MKKNKAFIISLLVTVLLIAANYIIPIFNNNSNNLFLYKSNGLAQGTYYSIVYYNPINKDKQAEIDSILTTINNSVSNYQKSSIISRINYNDNSVCTDTIFDKIFYQSKMIYEHTNGAFDVTVAPLVNSWGFGFINNDNHNPNIDSILDFVGMDKVYLENHKIIKQDPRIMIDFKAIAQGYSVDLIADHFNNEGINNYLIDIGGEVIVRGCKPDSTSWTIGIEKPTKDKSEERSLSITVSLHNKAIGTSGNYRKYIEVDGNRYSHAINPTTGMPAKNNLLSVSVIADKCILSDAYATAFMVMGFERAFDFVESTPNIEAYFICADSSGHKTYSTKGFKNYIK